MSEIILAYSYPFLAPGKKVKVLTDADHQAQGTTSKTASWGPRAERAFCNKTYTLTTPIIDRLINKRNITMSDFPENYASNDCSGNWVMHYADFKMAEIECFEDSPVYQVLKVKNKEIQHILLTPNEEQANTVKMAHEKENKDKETFFIKLQFTLKRKIIKEI